MDILSHAFAGAATGSTFGHPIAGAALAVFPDLVLLGKRRENPPLFYNMTHSLPGLFIVVGCAAMLGYGELAFWCIASHLILDLPTHGKIWAPPLFYPYYAKRYSMGQEWEFFNSSWWRGFFLTLAWIGVWIWFV